MVEKIAQSPARWSDSVHFDLTERFYARLRLPGLDDAAVEAWLICWDIGQDTLLHDHGAGAGPDAHAQVSEPGAEKELAKA